MNTTELSVWSPETWPEPWKDYELIDSGEFEKLERFGPYVVRRPEPQSIWKKGFKDSEWKSRADYTFIPEGKHGGRWEKKDQKLPDRWTIRFSSGDLHLQFVLRLTRFKHLGLFPEQGANWTYIYEHVRHIPHARVLNLFAYTGGASLAARAAGAEVVHCDALKQMNSWARENMEASQLKDIRWVTEDAIKFVKREVRRGKKFHGIILDPPAFGRGPKGEAWKLEEQITGLLSELSQLLEPASHFFVLNAYSLGYSALILKNLVQSHFGENLSNLEVGELVLREKEKRRPLPTGVLIRFFRN